MPRRPRPELQKSIEENKDRERHRELQNQSGNSEPPPLKCRPAGKHRRKRDSQIRPENHRNQKTEPADPAMRESQPETDRSCRALKQKCDQRNTDDQNNRIIFQNRQNLTQRPVRRDPAGRLRNQKNPEKNKPEREQTLANPAIQIPFQKLKPDQTGDQKNRKGTHELESD